MWTPPQRSNASSQSSISSISSFQNGGNQNDKPRRKFAVEPIETTTRSSKDGPKQTEDASQSEFGREHGQTDTTKHGASQTENAPAPKRRFAPQPIETTTRSSKDPPQQEKPRRRFAPEPIETSHVSSKDKKDVNGPRIDENGNIIRTPKIDDMGNIIKAPRVDDMGNIIRTPNPTPRIDENGNIIKTPNSTTSSGSGTPARRRFAPEPIETTRFSTRSSPNSNKTSNAPSTTSTMMSDSTVQSMPAAPLLPHEAALLGLSYSKPTPPSESKPRRRFAPQLIDTAHRYRFAGSTPEGKGARRERQSRSTVPAPRTAPSDTNRAPHTTLAQRRIAEQEGGGRQSRSGSSGRRRHSYRVPELDSIESSESDESPTRSGMRNDLRDIYDNTALTTDGALDDDSRLTPDEDATYKHATRLRESEDEKTSGYYLDLAALAAQNEYDRVHAVEYAAAAYPNFNANAPVSHYMDVSEPEGEEDEDDEEDDDEEEARGRVPWRPDPTRRDSGDERIALHEARQYAEESIKKQERELQRRKAEEGPEAVQQYVRDNFERPFDPELKRIMDASRPPMAGQNLGIPRCHSPDYARFDVSQGSEFLKQQMCYLTPEVEPRTVDENGLWAIRPIAKSTNGANAFPTMWSGVSAKSAGASKVTSSVWSSSRNASRRPTHAENEDVGLWGGLCTTHDPFVDSRGLDPTRDILTPARTPIATPLIEHGDPFSASVTSPKHSVSVNNSSSLSTSLPAQRSLGLGLNMHNGPKTPQRSPVTSTFANSNGNGKGNSPVNSGAALQKQLEMEAYVEAYFNDHMITQVYNYLSLGYPALAWKYDDELSRVTHIPVKELRTDDQDLSTHGFINLREDNPDIWQGNTNNTYQSSLPELSPEEMGRRWRALRRYVREWARQMFKSGDGDVPANIHDALGMKPIRRGSWDT